MKWFDPYMGIFYLVLPVFVAVTVLALPDPLIPAVGMPLSIAPFVAWSWHRDNHSIE